MASTATGFVSTLGADAPPTCYADVDLADLFLIAGSNLAVSAPVLFRRIRAGIKRNNSKVIVVDPRRTETAACSSKLKTISEAAEHASAQSVWGIEERIKLRLRLSTGVGSK